MITTMAWSTTPIAAADGQVLKVSDEYKAYYAILPPGMSLKDACIEFTWAYDFDDYMGNVYCRASLMEKGVTVESLRFDFRDGSSHIEFATT